MSNGVYQKVNVVLQWNSIFKKMNESRKRYNVYRGSAGSGKSVNIAQKIIKKLSDPFYKGSNLMCIRKVEASNRDSTFAELKAAIKSMFGEHADRVWNVPKGRSSAMHLKNYETGAEIIFRGLQFAEDIEKVKSVTFENGKLTDIWIEEATDITENEFNILDDRLRGILPPNLFYQIHLSFNPVNASHWIKGRFFDKPDVNADVNHSTYLNNRFIDDGYYTRMQVRKERDPEGYVVYGLGEWGEVGGLILSNYTIKDFDKGQFNTRVYGQDFGYTHANAILEVAFKDEDIYILNEIYVFEKDTVEIIELANEKGLSKNIPMWCDSAEPDRIKMWRKAGYRAGAVKKGSGSVWGQIEWLKGIVAKDKVIDRKIYIHPDCVNTIREIQMWRRKKDPKTNLYIDDPVEIEDDAMAALRYSIEGYRKPQVSISF